MYLEASYTLEVQQQQYLVTFHILGEMVRWLPFLPTCTPHSLFIQQAGDVNGFNIMRVEYMGILCQGKNCPQFRLLTLNSFIGLLGGGWGKGGIVILVHCVFHFIKYMKIWCSIQVP